MTDDVEGKAKGKPEHLVLFYGVIHMFQTLPNSFL